MRGLRAKLFGTFQRKISESNRGCQAKVPDHFARRKIRGDLKGKEILNRRKLDSSFVQPFEKDPFEQDDLAGVVGDVEQLILQRLAPGPLRRPASGSARIWSRSILRYP